ncbi:symbiosis-related protein, partial [Pisolithus thermaeus]
HPPKMMFTKSLMSSFFAFMSLLALAMSIPVQKRDVFVPPIISPNQGTVWYAGQEQEVTWDTENAPADITNSEGIIYLVVDNLIDFNYELASGFNILDGSVQVVAPNVATGTYAIVCKFLNSSLSTHYVY